jgi:hypothetical protein
MKRDSFNNTVNKSRGTYKTMFKKSTRSKKIKTKEQRPREKII